MVRKMNNIFGRESPAFHLDMVVFGEQDTKIISEVKDPTNYNNP